MARAAEEATSMENYEFIVINDDLEECVDAVNSIVVSESCKKENRTDFLIGIKNQLDERIK
jgi:guanylate kinase